MNMRYLYAAILTSFLCFSFDVNSEEVYSDSGVREPTLNDLLGLSGLFGAVISPDGNWVAYTELSPDYKEDVFRVSLWLVSTEGGDPSRVASGLSLMSKVAWSPDNRWLSFVRRDEDGRGQLHALPLDGGEARSLSKQENDIADYQWSPDGKSIAFLADIPKLESKKARESYYGEYKVFNKDYSLQQLWTIDVKAALEQSQPGQQRTRGDQHVTGLAWAPNGKQIAFSARIDPIPEHEDQLELYLLNLKDDSITQITEYPGMDENPVWAPDGSQIAFENYSENGADWNIMVVNLTSGAIKKAAIESNEWGGLVGWNQSGIFYIAELGTALHLYRIEKPGKKAVKFSDPQAIIIDRGNVSFSHDGKRMAFIAAMPNQRLELYVSESRKFSTQNVLTRQNEVVSNLKLGIREVISWESNDGTMIEGILTKPEDFDPNKQYPLLCIIHGGPRNADTPALSLGGILGYPIDLWANKGALVLQVNYRGSLGYGREFRLLNVANYGVGDSMDILSGIDHLIEQGIVDPDRLGCMGWSQGGFINAFFATTTDRFKALAMGAGISNWATQYYNTSIPQVDLLALRGKPHESPDDTRRASPMTYLENARTPILIQHGVMDDNVPVANAFEFQRGLEDVGVDVELILFPEMGHVSFKPRRVRVIMQQHLDWFGHYIWGEKKPDFSHPLIPEVSSDH